MDHALHGGEPHAGALELARRVQPLERREELPGVLGGEARAVVADEERAVVGPPERDAGCVGLRRELPRVADEVDEDHVEQRAVSPRDEALGDRHVDLPTGRCMPQVRHDPCRQ